jgi:glycerol-3-phosphate dehydrogenase subunit C
MSSTSTIRPIWQANLDVQPHPPHPVELTLDNCIKCNICVTACPVTAVTDLFPGPKYEAPQAGRFRNPKQETPDYSVDYCSGCRACNLACPTGVRIAEINARARADMVQDGEIRGIRRLRNNAIARTELVGKLGQPVAPLANWALNIKPARWVADRLFGIAPDAPFPPFTKQRFSRWLKKRAKKNGGNDGTAVRKVVYFHGCSTEYYEPRVGQAVIDVLERNGFEVIVPPQKCCGLPLLSNGEFGPAQELYEANIRNLVPYVKQGYVIVGTSTSCTLTLIEEAPELLGYSSPDAALIQANTYDFNDFLMQLHAAGQLDVRDLRDIPLTLVYHMPCQYKAHRIGRPGSELLHLIPGLNVVESEATCCGMAGTYGYKSEKRQIAIDVGQPLFNLVNQVDGPVVICESETCRWHITGVTKTPSVHPVEILAAAYGFKVDGPLTDLGICA